MSNWKNTGDVELIFGQHIVQPGQTMEVDDDKDVEVSAIEGFRRVDAREPVMARRRVPRGIDAEFGQSPLADRNPGSGQDSGKGDE